jgi:hypothetical protein
MLLILCQLLWPFLLILAVALCTPIVLGVRDVLFAIDTRHWLRAVRGVALVAMPGVVITIVCGGSLRSIPLCVQAPYSPLPTDFTESDLWGTWRASYGAGSTDTIVLRQDGLFKQIYQDPSESGYSYETPWAPWWLEYLPSGSVRIHLQGARFFPDGAMIAELDGWGLPCPESGPCLEAIGPYPFYDPIEHAPIEMIGELVLQVRVGASGRLLLHHMSLSGDEEGFALIGCESRQFRRVDAE